MPTQETSEEKYPLLFLFVEDGKSGSKQNRRIMIDKDRYEGITSGATAVITQWPNHITSYWVTSIFCGLTLLLVTMLLLTATSHHHVHTAKSRCIGSHIYNDQRMDYKTIHLVHTADSWRPHQIATLERLLKNNYPSFKIHLIIISDKKRMLTNTIHKSVPTEMQSEILNASAATNVTNTSQVLTETIDPSPHFRNKRFPKRNRKVKKFSTKPPSPNRKKRKTDPPAQDLELDIKVGAQNLFNVLLNHIQLHDASITSAANSTSETPSAPEATRTIEELLNNYPQIFVEHLSYNQVFKNSPLFISWRNLNDESRLFAIRVLYLWQYAGISFDLLETQEENLPNGATTYETVNGNGTTPSQQRIEISVNAIETPQSQLDNLIASGYSGFSQLPESVVSIDENGLHMGTKTSCHAFFGELLMNLRRANKKTKPSSLIKKAIALFCRKSAVDSKHCASIRD